MESATLLIAENWTLRAANAKVIKKRQKKKKFVGRREFLTGREVQERQYLVIIEEEVENQIIEPSRPRVTTCAPPMCSICRSLDHNACTCPSC